MLAPMTLVVYSSAAELSRPGAFLREALRDLRSAPRIGARLFTAQLRGRARRSLLGYLWLLLPPAAVTFLCLYLRTVGILKTGPTELLYVLSGVLLWQVFVEALTAPVQQVFAARQLISRSRIPHETVLLGAVFDVLLSAAVRVILLLAAFWLYGGSAIPGVALPLSGLALILLGFSIGLLIAPWALLYDDAKHALTMLATFWFFLTPVAYRAVSQGILALNPVTPLLETARSAFTGGAWSGGFLPVTLAAALLLAVAWLLYRRQTLRRRTPRVSFLRRLKRQAGRMNVAALNLHHEGTANRIERLRRQIVRYVHSRPGRVAADGSRPALEEIVARGRFISANHRLT
jgi:lipopolysaccharide transport system permease protein